MVLYRKYRPQTLEDLIGQDQVKKTLLNAFQNNKLSHAYLFVGPRGTGKTSTARILAKMINCESNVIPAKAGMTDGIPCNKCEICLSITDGSNLDLIEIDAASNRGIDDVRSLRENIKLSPSGKGKKVYIIDEVHMLTTEAFNALLKTLEEPPEHTLFILATTEGSKVPATILSRVTRLDFKPARQTDLVAALKMVAKGEKLEVEDEVLEILAQKAEGSFRDAVKLLDQVSSSGKITVKDVRDGLAVVQFETQIGLLELMAKKDGKESLALVNQQIEGGVGVKEFVLQLMEVLRSLVLIKNDLGENLVKEEMGSERFSLLVSLADQFSMNDLTKSLDALQIAFEKLKFASIPSLPLELAVVEICGAGLAAGSSGIKAPLATSQTKYEENYQGLAMDSFDDKPPAHQTSSIALNAQTSPASPTVEVKKKIDGSTDVTILEEKWTFILETIRPENFSLEALLRSVKIQSAADGLVILEVPYSFHQRILEAPKSKELLESVIANVLEKPARVTTVLGNRPLQVEDIVNVEAAADDEVIRLASEIFNGKLVD